MNATDPNASRDVILCECFARDGLQHETAFLATDHKQQLIERFAALGFLRIEATSYSNPSSVRLLRAPCGQVRHLALFEPAAGFLLVEACVRAFAAAASSSRPA